MYVKQGRPPVEKIRCTCTGCGKEVLRYAKRLAGQKSGRIFCSKACRDRIGCKPKKGADKACGQCGKVFYQRPMGTQKYCSRECHGESQTKPKTVRTCDNCGKEMRLKPSQADAGRRFCTKLCETFGRTINYAGFDFNGRPAVIDFFGYVRIWLPDHPKAQGGRVKHHRDVMEQALGRHLTADEQVDHINRIKTDNRLENLQLLSASDHSIKTNGDRLQDLAELAEYRKRYGPLT